MIDLPDTHLFKPTLESLKRQDFKGSWEFIVSDCRYEKRPDCFEGNPFKRGDYPFPIKHITVRPNYWIEHGMWLGSGTWNKGIVEAEGELIVFMDDASEFPDPNALSIYWEWYQKGYFASALTLYNRGSIPLYHGEEARKTWVESGRRDSGRLDQLFSLGERVKDSRWRFLEGRQYFYFPGQMYYAYTSCDMDAILKVNGWDQNFDGDKTLADVDLGIRLEQVGCRFVIDRGLTVIENAHKAIPSDTLFYEGNPPRSNYELMRVNRAKGRWRANSYRLMPEEAEHLRAYRHPGFDGAGRDMVPVIEEGTIEHKHFLWWVANPPIFDLRELRALK